MNLIALTKQTTALTAQAWHWLYGLVVIDFPLLLNLGMVIAIPLYALVGFGRIRGDWFTRNQLGMTLPFVCLWIGVQCLVCLSWWQYVTKVGFAWAWLFWAYTVVVAIASLLLDAVLVKTKVLHGKAEAASLRQPLSPNQET